MTLQFTYEVCEDYLYISASGPFAVESARQAFTEWMAEAIAASLNNVICDLAAIEGIATGDLPLTSRYDLAAFVAAAKPAHVRVVMLLTASQVPEDRFGEDVMVNRGANVMVTADLAEALAWLGVPR
jgi:hypothetical protein